MRLACALVLVLAGCDFFFPTPKAMPDGGMGDGGADLAGAGGPHLAGQLCALIDVRDYRSCVPARGVFRLYVEETQDQGLSDGEGRFFLPLLTVVQTATLVVIDPRSETVPVVVPLTLTDGILDPVAVPLVPSQTAQSLSFQTGVVLEQSRGALLAWAVDAEGRPVRGVAASGPGGVGPFSDGLDANTLEAGGTTGPRGLVALFDLAPGRVSLEVSPPPPMRGDTYPLPVRGGAFTLSTLLQR